VDVADARGGIYGSLRTAREGMLSRCGCGGRGVLVFVRWRGGDMVVIVSLLDSVRDVATGIASTLRNNGATTTMCFTSIRSGFRNTHLSILRERRRIIHGWLLRGHGGL